MSQLSTYTRTHAHAHTHARTHTGLLTPILVDNLVFVSVGVLGVGEGRHPPVHVRPVDQHQESVCAADWAAGSEVGRYGASDSL